MRGEWDGRIGRKRGAAEAAEFLGAEEGEDDGAPGARAGGKCVGEGEDGSGAGGIVVGAVVDGIAGGVGRADAKVVEMRGEQDDFGGQRGAAEDGDGVPGFGARRVLELGDAAAGADGGSGEGRAIFCRKEPLSPPGTRPSGSELGGGEEGGDVFVAGGGAAAVEFVVGEEGHVGANFIFQ